MNQTHSDKNDDGESTEQPLDEQALEEMTEETDETMAEARKQTDRAMATFHDQILPDMESGVVGDWEDDEGTPSKEDTRGAWPDWSGHRDKEKR